jgi:hypothetical protein
VRMIESLAMPSAGAKFGVYGRTTKGLWACNVMTCHLDYSSDRCNGQMRRHVHLR